MLVDFCHSASEFLKSKYLRYAKRNLIFDTFISTLRVEGSTLRVEGYGFAVYGFAV